MSVSKFVSVSKCRPPLPHPCCTGRCFPPAEPTLYCKALIVPIAANAPSLPIPDVDVLSGATATSAAVLWSRVLKAVCEVLDLPIGPGGAVPLRGYPVLGKRGTVLVPQPITVDVVNPRLSHMAGTEIRGLGVFVSFFG